MTPHAEVRQRTTTSVLLPLTPATRGQGPGAGRSRASPYRWAFLRPHGHCPGLGVVCRAPAGLQRRAPPQAQGFLGGLCWVATFLPMWRRGSRHRPAVTCGGHGMSPPHTWSCCWTPKGVLSLQKPGTSETGSSFRIPPLGSLFLECLPCAERDRGRGAQRAPEEESWPSMPPCHTHCRVQDHRHELPPDHGNHRATLRGLRETVRTSVRLVSTREGAQAVQGGRPGGRRALGRGHRVAPRK